MAGDYATSYAATAVHGLRIASVKGYLQQLRRVLHRLAKHPGESPRKPLGEQLLLEVQQEHMESNNKKLVSRVRLLEKFTWLPSTIVPADWLFIQACPKVPQQKHEGRSKQWATMHCLRRLFQAAKTKLDWEVVAMSAVSIAFGTRISEAATAAPDKAELPHRGTKGRAGLHRPKPPKVLERKGQCTLHPAYGAALSLGTCASTTPHVRELRNSRSLHPSPRKPSLACFNQSG